MSTSVLKRVHIVGNIALRSAEYGVRRDELSCRINIKQDPGRGEGASVIQTLRPYFVIYLKRVCMGQCGI